MTLVPWIPIAEKQPPERQVVIVCQDHDEDGPCIFSGWLRNGYDGVPRWWTYNPDVCLSVMGAVRATDWWLPLPAEHPQHGVVRGGSPG